ncbi:MAG: alcohol dehydrogenase catalytic domain-containing protein [Deltaproteobacteria bacterium]|nr:alcohol dehydrogenase catalytic domain-containing protein [Deltaproteobacteria bacterium]
MRVITYYNNKDVRLEERPRPKIGKGELLVKVEAAGICGSDVMEWYRVSKSPRILGHEIAGEIVEVGAGIEKYKKGDRIAASHHVPCYECHYCRLGHHTLCDLIHQTNFDPGGFAELIRIPAINVRHGIYPLPDHVSSEEATLIEPLACTVRAQRRAAIRKEQTVMVVGSGLAGLLHIILAKINGATRVFTSDLNPYRLEAARRFGADEVFHADHNLGHQLKRANENRLADVVIICVGAEAATLQSFDLVDRGGTILYYAPVSPAQIVPLRMNPVFWQQGATLLSSYAASPEDHHEALRLIAEGRVPVKDLITHRLGFSEASHAFSLVSQANDSLKVILDPSR